MCCGACVLWVASAAEDEQGKTVNDLVREALQLVDNPTEDKHIQELNQVQLMSCCCVCSRAAACVPL